VDISGYKWILIEQTSIKNPIGAFNPHKQNGNHGTSFQLGMEINMFETANQTNVGVNQMETRKIPNAGGVQ
jgi:hypothetical protein